MNKITQPRTEERKIENSLNKIGFILGYCKHTQIVTIDKPMLKKCFPIGHYKDTLDMLKEIEEWLKSDANKFNFYFNCVAKRSL